MPSPQTVAALNRSTGYQLRPSDLIPIMRPCPHCGRPRAELVPIFPEGTGPSVHSFDQLGGLTDLIQPRAADTPCSACRLKATIARLFPARRGAIMSEAEAFIAQARASAADNPPAPPPTVPPGLFDAGRIHATPAGLLACGRRTDADLEPFRYEAGWPNVLELVRRHVAGDFGAHGAGGEFDRGRRFWDGASVADRNAAAIADGVGTVASTWPPVVVWTELGEIPATLVALAMELP